MSDLLQERLRTATDDESICKCGKDGNDFHTCPFAEGIDDDHESLCNCCDECTENCLMDIF